MGVREKIFISKPCSKINFLRFWYHGDFAQMMMVVLSEIKDPWPVGPNPISAIYTRLVLPGAWEFFFCPHRSSWTIGYSCYYMLAWLHYKKSRYLPLQKIVT
jgi:hypothetical protein